MDWFATQRHVAIEIIAYWTGRLNTRDLIDAFGITRIQASRDIKAYVQAHPGNLYYDGSLRRYIKASGFTCHLTKGCADEYLNLMHQTSGSDAEGVEQVTTQGFIHRIQVSYGLVSPGTLTPLLEAIREGVGINMRYASMNHPSGTTRTLYPHVIVDSGVRWHVRGYCEARKDFLDFNLARIIGSPTLVKQETPHGAEDDELWNKQVNIELGVNPKLNDAQQKLIALEFQMKKGKLQIQTRSCFVHYLLLLYQVGIFTCNTSQPEQRLVLLNKEELTPYLFC